MQVFGVWGDVTNFSVVDALVVALVAILLVFLVLTIIILVTTGIQKGWKRLKLEPKFFLKKKMKY